MIMLILIVGLLLMMLFASAGWRIEDANEEVRQEMGAAYKADASGEPERDGCLLVVLVLLAAGLVFSVLINVAPILPK